MATKRKPQRKPEPSRPRMSSAKVDKLTENAIALAADIFGSPDWAEFYRKHGETFQGCGAIYAEIRRIAEALTDYEIRKRIDWGCDDRFPEWIETIEAIAGAFLETGEAPDVETIINRIPK